MTRIRMWALPALLVVNGVLSVAIADRAATLRRSWQTWEVRREAQARLKHLSNPQNRDAEPLPPAPP